MTIGVFVVEDSPIALQVLSNIIDSAPDIKLVGTATNGIDALLQIPKVNPDVVCTDLYMKGMDGLELTRQLMSRYPKPILVISVGVGKGQEQNVFQLLEAGAIDVVAKPETGLLEDYDRSEIVQKIRILAGVKVFTRPLRPSPTSSALPRQAVQPKIQTEKHDSIKIIAIGASTGGPQAVGKILCQLPKDFPLPILCTQHISIGFLDGLVNWMNQECQLRVKIAEVGEELQPGIVYYAPDQFNLEVSKYGKIILSPPYEMERHCPSVNVMFRSVALNYGSACMGILLTGMGDDGAQGLQTIALAGGVTVAQDEEGCAVFGMPKAAIDLGVVQHTLKIEAISQFIMNYL
ncbi:MAG: chemotaxis-specific protein-glutamate methyltransferase CheB [Pseudanabaenaceae cyanobacterium SKYGB_i_bin29]|nr:chemotaxis-specific protein-glutamate methyltransferase CheB [Pseudanabaenaceae cyanobacterium SKYG29]MDW8422032.1 chemotaxis-specific protein-glutamate methyltransferase CheB [Pseudanabaenaceae cyanobacterium SKYGB_i_bin29]